MEKHLKSVQTVLFHISLRIMKKSSVFCFWCLRPCFQRCRRWGRRILVPTSRSALFPRCGAPLPSLQALAFAPALLCSFAPETRWPCSPPMPPWLHRAANTCAAISGIAFLRASSSASAAIFVRWAGPNFRFCTMCFPLCWCACRALIWPAAFFRKRCCPWALPARRARCFP